MKKQSKQTIKSKCYYCRKPVRKEGDWFCAKCENAPRQKATGVLEIYNRAGGGLSRHNIEFDRK